MKKGLWNLIGKVPVLVLAVAVGPVAMADGPMVPSGSATPPATPGQSGPIQTIAMDTNSYDTNMVPPAAPAPVAAPAAPRLRLRFCQPGCSFCSPACSCGPEGGCTFSWSPDKWCNVGLGIRTSFNELSSTANVSGPELFRGG